jgi:hypothetical protein
MKNRIHSSLVRYGAPVLALVAIAPAARADTIADAVTALGTSSTSVATGGAIVVAVGILFTGFSLAKKVMARIG